jgi:hypothetical protein
MEYHVDSSGVQAAGLYLLRSLASIENYQETLVHKNISNIVLKTMENHKRSNVLQKNGIEVFNLVCKKLLQLSDNSKY